MSDATLCHRARRLFACVALLGGILALAGCGGGGDDAPSAPAASNPTEGQAQTFTTAAAQAEPASVPAPATENDTCGIAGFREEVLRLVNEFRTAPRSCGSAGNFEAAPAVVWNDLLMQAASGHSRDMAAQNYFSHVSMDGRRLQDRVNATGYLWVALGENIAAGYDTVSGVMAGWQASPGHCANLMNPRFTQMGVACVPGTATSTYSHYWAMELGLPN